MSEEVLVIGSGLSAVGAIKALIRLGIKPVVLDYGTTLDDERSRMAADLSAKQPADWTDKERELLSHNYTLNEGASIPKKLLFGSDYFYGTSINYAPVKYEGNLPPFSYAKGGFSVGWGAASLPPQACDIADWPVSIEDINQYCEEAISELPYSAQNDGLSLNFPILHNNPLALQLSGAEKIILERLDRASILEKDSVVYGQSRLLVCPETNQYSIGCRYCGQCMSGCVYKSIYKSNDDISRLSENGLIEYHAGSLVTDITEDHNRVYVKYKDKDGLVNTRVCDRVFLAAGAVNSTRIVLNSLGIYERKVRLQARGGYVMPVFSFKKLPVSWPDCNTQPGLFLEYKGKNLERWVHVQISAANELLYQKLKMKAGANGFQAWIKKYIAEHIILMFVNYHSDYAGYYELWLSRPVEGIEPSCLNSMQHKSSAHLSVTIKTLLKLCRYCFKIGCIPLVPFARNNSGSYHVGGSLPMSSCVENDLQTDELGRVRAWKRVHVVDTSVFTSLPGTTVGLLAMANAMRIVNKIRWKNT